MTRELEPLLAEGVIDEILGRLKSGKEADIYLVSHAGKVVAAKVYKDANQRSFKNNADYKEGRGERSSRTRRAIESGSRFGKKAQEDAWRGTEAEALRTLHAAGVRVPLPVLFYEGILLMSLVTAGEGGAAAPRLIEVAYTVDEARPLYLELRRQLILILSCGLVHGDLSPYNILVAADGPTVIDFPQVVSVSHNSRAEFFFMRDFKNLLDFVVGIDPGLYAAFEGDGRTIWRAYLRHELTPEYFPPPSAARAVIAPRAGGGHAVPRSGLPPREQRPDPPQDLRRGPHEGARMPPTATVRPDYEASPVVPVAAAPPRPRPAPVPKYVVPERYVPGAPPRGNDRGRDERGNDRANDRARGGQPDRGAGRGGPPGRDAGPPRDHRGAPPPGDARPARRDEQRPGFNREAPRPPAPPRDEQRTAFNRGEPRPAFNREAPRPPGPSGPHRGHPASNRDQHRPALGHDTRQDRGARPPRDERRPGLAGDDRGPRQARPPAPPRDDRGGPPPPHDHQRPAFTREDRAPAPPRDDRGPRPSRDDGGAPSVRDDARPAFNRDDRGPAPPREERNPKSDRRERAARAAQVEREMPATTGPVTAPLPATATEAPTRSETPAPSPGKKPLTRQQQAALDARISREARPRPEPRPEPIIEQLRPSAPIRSDDGPERAPHGDGRRRRRRRPGLPTPR